MNKNMVAGFYTYNGEEVPFNFYTSLDIANKFKFVNLVVNTLVDDGYYSVIRDLIFDYSIIKTFTDVDTSYIDNSEKDGGSISAMEDFINNTNIVEIVKANVDDGVIEELNNCVDNDIEYRTGIHKNSIGENLSNLLRTIEKKVSSFDVGSITKLADVFSNMSGDVTADKILEAYAKSDVFNRIK